MDWQQVGVNTIGSAIGALIGGIIAYLIARYQINSQNEKEFIKQKDMEQKSKTLFKSSLYNCRELINKVLLILENNFEEYNDLQKFNSYINQVCEIVKEINKLLISEKHSLNSEDVNDITLITILTEDFVERAQEFLRSENNERKSILDMILDRSEELDDLFEKFY
ncbi:hypothetical protein ABES38_11680 [Bacillus gobiensis]|uniref:hypothetical protein n=1 Tax=Bacillus gobiensis TaxID=1441095 RepID=UPI003D22F44E